VGDDCTSDGIFNPVLNTSNDGVDLFVVHLCDLLGVRRNVLHVFDVLVVDAVATLLFALLFDYFGERSTGLWRLENIVHIQKSIVDVRANHCS